VSDSIYRKLALKLANRFGFYAGSQLRGSPGFSAANVTRLTNSWTTGTLSVNATIRNDLNNLRARSRDLAQNNSYAVKFMSILRTNILGESGMLLRNAARDPTLVIGGKEVVGEMDVFANSLIQRNWKEWGKPEWCTVTKNMTWQTVNELCLTSVARDGDVFVQLVTDTSSPFGLRLRLFESDFVDIELNKPLQNGNEIKMGVEFTSQDQPVAYWMRRSHPNDAYYGSNLEQKFERITADKMVHPFAMQRLHQARGLPWMAPVMDPLNMLGAYEEAETVRARVGASSHGFFKKTEGNGVPLPDDGLGNKRMDMEPGQWDELPQGVEPHVVDLNSPNPQFDMFETRILRSIAAGLQTSYNVLGEDMSSVNFSSMRMGLMEPREVYKMMQTWWANTFCSPIFHPWLLQQLTTQKIPLPVSKFGKFCCPGWKGRRWPYIEPNKDVDAAIKRMGANLSSLTGELAQIGVERDDLLAEIASDNAALEAHGLTSAEVLGGPAPATSTATNDDDDDTEPDEMGEPEEDNKVATENIKREADAYGVLVRAGVLTPNEQDEDTFREKLGIPAPPEVKAAWAEDDGTRRPITLAPSGGGTAPPPPQQSLAEDEE